ncbi:hypothetical protein BRADI_3g48110v3 [Brachypodium distachyon]|uniref:Uncharacterized protein n=2 Tax=Brachypodium distachyon TaxID=15368 RepID=I1IBC7_BRADI|nr:hypothetical protein BRADI_3g48110v3 [Brachypodium distachyon]
MAKYNVVQKNKREFNQDRKRQAHGDPNSGKLKHRNAPVSMSGKRKRKLLRRHNRDQKEAVMVKALENNMGDVEMASAEASLETAKDKSQMKFNVKNSRIQIKRLKGKGRNKAKNAKQPTKEKADAMVE